MLEIYNEEYKDLLGKGPPSGALPSFPTHNLLMHLFSTKQASLLLLHPSLTKLLWLLAHSQSLTPEGRGKSLLLGGASK